MEKTTLLLPFCERFIVQQQKLTARGTWKVLRTCKNHLTNFEKKKGKSIDFEDVTIDLLGEWVTYLYDTHLHSKNYAAKMIECLKQFMNAAKEDKLHKNEIYQSRRFAVKKMMVFDIALSDAEINTIASLNLDDYPRGYETARDYFVLNCYLGLRYSDWHQITKQNMVRIGGKSYLSVAMQKTSRRITIPINSKVKVIWEKYGGELPKPLTNQCTNRYLKDIAMVAGLVDSVEKTISKSGQSQRITLEKYEMVKTHTARRSFATNAYLQGMDVLLIRNITGHQDDREFYKYIKINGLEKSRIAANHSFFQ